MSIFEQRSGCDDILCGSRLGERAKVIVTLSCAPRFLFLACTVEPAMSFCQEDACSEDDSVESARLSETAEVIVTLSCNDSADDV